MITIYVLLENKEIRYIGKTTQANMHEKLDQHLKEARLNPEKYEWIVRLEKSGGKPDIKAIFTYDEKESEYYEDLFIHDFRFLLGLKLSETDGFKGQSLFKPGKGTKTQSAADSWISPN
jgi:hypothetical protein